MTFNEANSIIAEKEKHTDIERGKAYIAFGIGFEYSLCTDCDKFKACAMRHLQEASVVTSCNFFKSDNFFSTETE